MAGDSESEQSRSKRRGWPPRVVQCRLQKGEGDFGRRWWKVEGRGATRFLDGLGFAGRRQLAEGGRLRSQVQGGVSARIADPKRG